CEPAVPWPQPGQPFERDDSAQAALLFRPCHAKLTEARWRVGLPRRVWMETRSDRGVAATCPQLQPDDEVGGVVRIRLETAHVLGPLTTHYREAVIDAREAVHLALAGLARDGARMQLQLQASEEVAFDARRKGSAEGGQLRLGREAVRGDEQRRGCQSRLHANEAYERVGGEVQTGVQGVGATAVKLVDHPQVGPESAAVHAKQVLGAYADRARVRLLLQVETRPQ